MPVGKGENDPMRRKSFSILALALGLLAAQLCFRVSQRWAAGQQVTQDAQGADEGIWLRPPPRELEDELRGVMRKISEEYPITEDHVAQITEAVEALNLKYPARNDSMRGVIQNFGMVAIPVIAPKSADSNPEVREKALCGLAYLRKPRDFIDERYAETEAALILCYLRSLHDAEPRIRAGCAAALVGFAKARWPDPPARAVSAVVVTAVTDPDESVRFAALTGLFALGIPIRHPLLPEDLHID